MRRNLIRIATLSLALVALGAPAAVARPAADPAPPVQHAAQFPERPVLDRSPVTPDSPAKPAPPARGGVDWDTIGLFGGIGLVAVGALAGAAAARVRRTRVAA
jgi:hypothetical protein